MPIRKVTDEQWRRICRYIPKKPPAPLAQPRLSPAGAITNWPLVKVRYFTSCPLPMNVLGPGVKLAIVSMPV